MQKSILISGLNDLETENIIELLVFKCIVVFYNTFDWNFENLKCFIFYEP